MALFTDKDKKTAERGLDQRVVGLGSGPKFSKAHIGVLVSPPGMTVRIESGCSSLTKLWKTSAIVPAYD